MYEQASTQTPVLSGQPFWRSKSLAMGVLMTLAGLAMWVYSAATRPVNVPPPAAPAITANGFTSGTPVTPAPATARLVDDSAPALFRFGLSFVAGFFGGWVMRKFIKWTLLAAGAIAAGYFALEKMGLVTSDLAGLKSEAERGVQWAEHEAGAVKTFLLGYVPSAASGVTGMYFGARKA